MTITRETHPKLFNAMLLIDYDSGAVNRFEPASTEYHVPEPWEPYIAVAETALGTLTQQEYETFCCGDCADQEKIERRSGALQKASQFLNTWFTGWADAPTTDSSLLDGAKNNG